MPRSLVRQLARDDVIAIDPRPCLLAIEPSHEEGDDFSAERLAPAYFFLSSQLKQEILARLPELDPRLIDEIVDAHRRDILVAAAADAAQEINEARQFIGERIFCASFNETLLKDLVEMRRWTEFALAFAHYAAIDAATARLVLADRSWESLAIVARAAGLERSTFAKIVFTLQNSVAEQDKALRMLDLYLKIPKEAADAVMTSWRARAGALDARIAERRATG